MRNVPTFPALALAAFACGIACHREPEAARAAREQVLLVATPECPSRLDPHLIDSPSRLELLSSMFEGLTMANPADPRSVLPAAAERWSSDENHTEWTFELRRDAEWSDGAPVTAHDFVFAYRRILLPSLEAPCADALDPLAGARELRRSREPDPTAAVARLGVSAVDDFTLRLRLTGPMPNLPALTSHHAWWPVPRHTVLEFGAAGDRSNGWSAPENLTTNGRFRPRSWFPGHHWDLEKNPGHPCSRQTGLNGIRFLAVPTAETAATAFLAGQLHLTSTQSGAVTDRIRALDPESLLPIRAAAPAATLRNSHLPLLVAAAGKTMENPTESGNTPTGPGVWRLCRTEVTGRSGIGSSPTIPWHTLGFAP